MKMQSQDSKVDLKNDDLEKKLELSEAWRRLLGMETDAVVTAGSGQEETPLVSGDPWASLVHAQGIQVVDLQQVHLHIAHRPMDEQDVEHALDIMREVPLCRGEGGGEGRG
jgi:hypothetical protein